ncbi:MAG: PaaI family thioesterase [Rhizomicrobium sp.]
MNDAAIFDRFPRPPCADLLGWTLLDFDAAAGWAKLAFEGRREFLNPAGFVQGGMLAAMLDDSMGPAALLMSGGTRYTATISMTVSYLAPARPGRFIAEARVLQLGKTVAFLESSLADASGVTVARATASARLVPVERLAA